MRWVELVAMHTGQRDRSRFHRLDQGIQPLLNLPRQGIQQVMLFLLGERGKKVIKQRGGGTDELAGVSFHGQTLTILPQGVGHLWG